ncbi:hypothetical protein OIU84_020760 [Salix udensis]|uniref:BTB domain-containing protein n=1 Tax=Salix udensis TaxID=889485 RepID=A0AAD6KT07_9ROSI|nr:hypothetical protein OIU84_020760 [Salix udensis]
MNCTVGVVRTHLEGPKQYSISVPPSDMGWGFKELLESETGCDIDFQVGDETFRSHKLILAARSPVFRAQFFGLVGDPNMDKVVVKDVDPLIFKAMLLFIYTDKLPDAHEITGSTSMCTSTNMVQHLLALSDLYNLDRLKLLCESKLCEELSAENVATTLALAEQHQCMQLKAICLKFAANPANLGAVMQSEGFRHLEESCPSMLCELLKTLASGDENSRLLSGRKRSGSSLLGVDLADGAPAESSNPNGRRLRRREARILGQVHRYLQIDFLLKLSTPRPCISCYPGLSSSYSIITEVLHWVTGFGMNNAQNHCKEMNLLAFHDQAVKKHRLQIPSCKPIHFLQDSYRLGT